MNGWFCDSSGVEQCKRRGPAFVEPRLFFNFSSQLDLLGDAKCVVDLDAQIADGAFELGMSQQELNRPQVARFLINLRRFGPTHRVGAIGRAVKAGALDPLMDNPRILSGRKVRLRPEAAREQVLPVPHLDAGEPLLNR